MADAVRCLKDLSRECQKLFEDAVGGPALAGDCINALAMFNSRTGLRGMEAISRNTADSFALSNYPYWLKELHCAYDLDTSGKLSALEQLRYSGAGVQVVCEQWRVQPGPQGGGGDPWDVGDGLYPQTYCRISATQQGPDKVVHLM